MTVNYEYSYTKKDKFIFVQNAFGIRIGTEILDFVAKSVSFPAYYFHYQDGGHVAAIHRHLNNAYFFKIDYKNFFYSISRNRVAAALHDAGHPRARTFAKWSCVRNPIKNGLRYALPIGFVQSPALATMALMRTNVANVLDQAGAKGVYVSVYLDDLIGSGNDPAAVQEVFDELIEASKTANLQISPKKLVAPCTSLIAFNCDLSNGKADVTADRRADFYSIARSAFSADAFEKYCDTVSANNI
ncbi:MAG: hypothetical protein MIN69_12150 [Methylorubrum extorquens]|jgi:hypothetical protein|uniref:reverse transcriptase domain-containing protein n=1 Tax=Methylorubrum extorquens TaxID=408 RepID=UPI002FEE390E